MKTKRSIIAVAAVICMLLLLQTSIALSSSERRKNVRIDHTSSLSEAITFFESDQIDNMVSIFAADPEMCSDAMLFSQAYIASPFQMPSLEENDTFSYNGDGWYSFVKDSDGHYLAMLSATLNGSSMCVSIERGYTTLLNTITSQTNSSFIALFCYNFDIYAVMSNGSVYLMNAYPHEDPSEGFRSRSQILSLSFDSDDFTSPISSTPISAVSDHLTETFVLREAGE